MSTFTVRVRGTTEPPLSREALDSMSDDVMDALLDVGVNEPAVSVAFDEAILEVELVVQGDTAADALRVAQALVLRAMRLADVRTEDDEDSVQEWLVRREPLLASA